MLNPIKKFKRSILHLNTSLHHWFWKSVRSIIVTSQMHVLLKTLLLIWPYCIQLTLHSRVKKLVLTAEGCLFWTQRTYDLICSAKSMLNRFGFLRVYQLWAVKVLQGQKRPHSAIVRLTKVYSTLAFWYWATMVWAYLISNPVLPFLTTSPYPFLIFSCLCHSEKV